MLRTFLTITIKIELRARSESLPRGVDLQLAQIEENRPQFFNIEDLKRLTYSLFIPNVLYIQNDNNN